jgi:hypothetical protein
VGGRAGGRADEPARTLSLSPSRTLVTPTTSAPTLAQDNTSRGFSPPCVPSCANTSGLGHAATILLVGPGTPGVETPTVGALGRGLLRVDEQLPVKLQMCSLQQPLHPRTLLRFWSLEFMSLDGSYDMVLLPPQRDSDNGGRQPARRRQTQRRLPPMAEEQHASLSRHLPRRRRRRRGNHGQAGGGTSSAVERVDDAGTPAGTSPALTSRPRRRRVSFPRNTPTPSGPMTPAHSRRTCWALASYLR